MDLKGFKEFERNRGKSEKTIESYISDIKGFLKYLKTNEIEIEELQDFNWSKYIEKYKSYLIKEKYKATTINRKILSLNRLIKYLNLDVKVKLLKIQNQKILDDVISKDEVQRLLSCCDNARDRAIITTLFHTGMRVSELLTLTIHDVGKSEVQIMGKGNKYRTVLLAPKVRKSLLEYSKVRGKSDTDLLFLGQRGSLRRQSVNKILHKYNKKAHVQKSKVHPHSFRHAFCKTLSELGQPIDVIADLVGHESLDTTRIYTRRTRVELQRILDF